MQRYLGMGHAPQHGKGAQKESLEPKDLGLLLFLWPRHFWLQMQYVSSCKRLAPLALLAPLGILVCHHHPSSNYSNNLLTSPSTSPVHPTDFIFVAIVAKFTGSNGSSWFHPPPHNNGYSKKEGTVTNLWQHLKKKRWQGSHRGP